MDKKILFDEKERELRIKELEATVNRINAERDLLQAKTGAQKLSLWQKYMLALFSAATFLGAIPARTQPPPPPPPKNISIKTPPPTPNAPSKKHNPKHRLPVARPSDEKNKQKRTISGKSLEEYPNIRGCSDFIQSRLNEILQRGIDSIKSEHDFSAQHEHIIEELRELKKNQTRDSDKEAIEFFLKSLEKISKDWSH